jgi:hypothetical protein
MANAFKSPAFLDIDMDKVAVMLALMGPDGRGVDRGLYPVQPHALQNPADGCRRHGGDLGDVLSGEALTAQGDHPVHDGGRDRPIQMPGS